MKTLITAVVLSASFLGTAYAQEATEPLPVHQSSVTRAQVQQELAQAKANGLWFNGQDEESNAHYAASGSNASVVGAAVPKQSPQAREQFQATANGTSANYR